MRMKKRAIIIAGTAASAVLVLGLHQWQLASLTIRSRIVAGLENATKSRVDTVGTAELAILPTPHISLRDVKITRPDGIIIANVPHIRAQIGLLPLLSGRLEYDDLQFAGPQINMVVSDYADNPSEWLEPALQVLTHSAGHGRITIVDGSVAARKISGAMSAITSKVNIVVARRKASDPIELAGSLVWRGEQANVSAHWPVTAAEAPARLNVSAPVLSWSFDGSRVATAGRILKGKLRVDAPSAKSALNWVEAGTPIIEMIGPLKLAANAQFMPESSDLTSVVAHLGNDRLEGALTIDTSGPRWSMGGTLAGVTLDLGSMIGRMDIAGLSLPEAPNMMARNLEALTNHNLDLRLSIDTLRLGAAKLTDVAAQLLVKAGRLDANILQGSAYGGTVKARLTFSQNIAGLDFRLQAGFDKTDLGKLSADLPEFRRFSGTGYGQLALSGTGTTYADVANGLSGKLSLSARNGDIAGVALSDLLKRVERQPLSAFREWRGGRSTYDIAMLNGTLTNGIFEITESTVTGTGYKLLLSGRSSLINRQMALSGVLTGGSTGLVRLPFEATGPLFDPLITPDTQVLIQRSGAAGPLLVR